MPGRPFEPHLTLSIKAPSPSVKFFSRGPGRLSYIRSFKSVKVRLHIEHLVVKLESSFKVVVSDTSLAVEFFRLR